MTYTKTVENIINMNDVDTTVIQETVAAANASTQPKGFVSQIQLRTAVHSYASRGETGQVQTTNVGGTVRGNQSENARTRAVRLGLPQFAEGLNVWEIRGRDVAERVYTLVLSKSPQANKRLALDVAFIAAFVGVSKAQLKPDKAAHRDYITARDERLELIERHEAGEDLTEDEIYLAEHPWVDVIPSEATIQVYSIWDLERISRYVVEDESILKPALLASALSWKDLVKDITMFLTGGEAQGITIPKMPGLGAACFGQMKADLPASSVVGAVSTNKAFTTGAAKVKASLFTAVGDDPTDDSHSGAEFMSLKETNTGTFCEPAIYNIEQFKRNLGYLTPAQQAVAAGAVYKAMALCPPTGGQRANLTRCFPELIVNVVSSLQPVSYESGFSNAVVPVENESEMLSSAKQLLSHIASFKSFLGEMGNNYTVLVLMTPLLREQIGMLPEGFIACENIDDMITQTNALTGVGQ